MPTGLCTQHLIGRAYSSHACIYMRMDGRRSLARQFDHSGDANLPTRSKARTRTGIAQRVLRPGVAFPSPRCVRSSYTRSIREDRLRCRADSLGKSVARKPSRETDPSTRNSLDTNCRNSELHTSGILCEANARSIPGALNFVKSNSNRSWLPA